MYVTQIAAYILDAAKGTASEADYLEEQKIFSWIADVVNPFDDVNNEVRFDVLKRDFPLFLKKFSLKVLCFVVTLYTT